MKKLVLLIFIVGFLSCQNSISPDYFTTDISGIVTNQNDGQPIENAKVFVFRTYSYNNGKSIVIETEIFKETATDELGFYKLNVSLKEGKTYKVAADKVGYENSKYYCAPEIKTVRIQSVHIQLRKF